MPLDAFYFAVNAVMNRANCAFGYEFPHDPLARGVAIFPLSIYQQMEEHQNGKHSSC